MQIKKEYNFSKIEDFLNENFSAPTHWPDWNIVVSQFFNINFFYFGAYENNELFGICPVHKEKIGLVTHYNSGQYHYIPYGGWLCSKATEISLNAIPIHNFSNFQAFNLPSLPEFKSNIKGKNKKEFMTLVIDLSDDLDTIWKEQVDAKRRNMIRKAEKNGILLSDNQLDLDTFYNIYEQASLRSSLTLLPKEFFNKLFSNAKNIRFEIISAIKDDEHLSNVVIAYDKNYSIYWLGNTADNVPNLGQGELLQWEAIKRMKEHGCRYYDLCYIEKERLPHIYRFKSGFAKNEVDVPLVTFKKLSYKIVRKFNKWF